MEINVQTGAGVETLTVSAEPDITMDITNAASGSGDHRVLTNRDAADQHPISAITGLEDEITDALTNFDIFEIMQGG